jgi:hypothetical protein
VSALGHYLERAGIPTAGISLVREHSEKLRPPRALWVPFMLGRPLGVPDDPAFQHEVLRAVLALFEAPSGPVLRDFPRDAPDPANGADGGGAAEGDACPVAFARPPAEGSSPDALGRALAAEIAQLRPWHDLAVRRRGTTTVGLSGRSPEDAAAFLLQFVARPGDPGLPAGAALGVVLKQASDDLRAYYEEAAGAQPGPLGAGAMQRWFHLQTHAGEAIAAVRQAMLAHADAGVRAIAERTLVPRAILMARATTGH